MSHAFAARPGAASQQTEPVTVKQQPASGSGIAGFYNTIAAHRFLFPTLVFLVHFLIVQVAATVAYVYATSAKSSGPYESSLGPPKDMSGFWANFVGPLRLWDGLWYKQIAEHLYSFGDANAAFWPLLPWVMRYGHDATGLEYEVVGYLFVNLCFLAALIVLYQLIPIDFSNALPGERSGVLPSFQRRSSSPPSTPKRHSCSSRPSVSSARAKGNGERQELLDCWRR